MRIQQIIPALTKSRVEIHRPDGSLIGTYPIECWALIENNNPALGEIVPMIVFQGCIRSAKDCCQPNNAYRIVGP